MEKEDKNKLFVLGLFIILAIGMCLTNLVNLFTDESLSDDNLHFDKLDLYTYPINNPNNGFTVNSTNSYISNFTMDVWETRSWEKENSLITIEITIPIEYEDCFIKYVKDNYKSWFDNITLDCSKLPFNAKINYWGEKSLTYS